jgi:RHS repeat-associated protein
MTYRQANGQTYNLAYDAENRLIQVTGAATASFVYDGDGKRVLSVEGGTTTVFIGNYFEWTGTAASAVRYYYAGSTRLARRQGSGSVTWLLGDHLGSTSVSYDGTNDLHQGYKPWGETRYGSVPTGYQYTGQFNQQSTGLYYYGARWYDPYLNRWNQPDSVIPDYYNPLDWDRYSYTRNNPLFYSDPTGHIPACDRDDWGCQYHWDYPIVDDNNDYKFETGLSEEEVNIIHNIEDLVAPILFDTIDWMMMYEDCTEGRCSPFMLLGLLGPLPGGKADDITSALIKANKKGSITSLV